MERPATFQDMMSMVQETLLLFVSFSSFFLSFFLKSVTTTCTVNTVFYSDECVKFRSVPSWNEVQSIATIGVIDALRLVVFVLALL